MADESSQCYICFDYEFGDDDAPYSCGHLIHKDCLLKSGKALCPVCRAELTDELTSDELDTIEETAHEHRMDNMRNSVYEPPEGSTVQIITEYSVIQPIPTIPVALFTPVSLSDQIRDQLILEAILRESHLPMQHTIPTDQPVIHSPVSSTISGFDTLPTYPQFACQTQPGVMHGSNCSCVNRVQRRDVLNESDQRLIAIEQMTARLQRRNQY